MSNIFKVSTKSANISTLVDFNENCYLWIEMLARHGKQIQVCVLPKWRTIFSRLPYKESNSYLVKF